MKAPDAQASLFSYLGHLTWPLDFFFSLSLSFSMFGSHDKSFLQDIDVAILSSLFLFKEKTSSQFDEFEDEMVNALGKGCVCGVSIPSVKRKLRRKNSS